MNKYQIAVIAGDGIGREVIPEGIRALEAVGRKHEIDWSFVEYDFGCGRFLQTGEWFPGDGLEAIRENDAIFFGAVGDPKVPDHESLWGLLIPMRRAFGQYVNLRPVKRFDGLTPRIVECGGEIDMVIVRENSEGEYSRIGGLHNENTDDEVACQLSVFTRKGVDRIIRYAFQLAQGRPRRRVTSATKSNGITITMPYWDKRFKKIAAEFDDIEREQLLIDNFCAQMVIRPWDFDVIVASNLFGDILSDLAPAVVGALGIAPSGNINPERTAPSMFEPVHGSAPDIAGKGWANPIAQIWSGALMLDHLGETDAAAAVLGAIERVLADRSGPKTRDMGGNASTSELGEAIVAAL